MSDRRQVQGTLAARSATLADPARLMRQAFDHLNDLKGATGALGEALVAAGLPRRAWRSEQALLRLLSEALPAITLGTFLARLEDFAGRSGPDWLREPHDDMEALHTEVGVLSEVARPLLGAVRRLQRPSSVSRRRGADPGSALQRALCHPRVQPPLTAIAEILSGFEARAPLMRAMQAVQSAPAAQPFPHVPKVARPQTARVPDFAPDPHDPEPFPADTVAAAGGQWTEGSASADREVAAPAATLRARAAALAARIVSSHGAVPTLPVGLVRLVGFRQQRLSPGRWPRGWRLAASAVLALAVVVIGTLQVLSHLAPASSSTPSFSSSSPSTPAASLTALAVSAATATAPATGAPTPVPAPSATAGPAPKLTLSCTLHGTTATLTLKNVGTSSFTWQAQPPPTVTTTPAQGALDAGQSAAVQVSAKNKKTPTGTIQVVATHGSQSTEGRVSCR